MSNRVAVALWSVACVLASCSDDRGSEITTRSTEAISIAQAKNGGTGATSATFDSAESAGDLNVVLIGWADNTATVSSVTDTRGNTYTLAAPLITIPGSASLPPLSQAIYYAKNIAGGVNTVNVAFNGSPFYPDLRVVEYSGVDTSAPLIATTGSSGNANGGDTVSSGNITTTSAGALLVAGGMTTWSYDGAGASFTARLMTADGNIAEDSVVGAAGSYGASAHLSGPGQNWILQVAAFKPAANVPPPPTLTSIAPNSGSAAGGTNVTLSGSGFVSGATVRLCGVAATNVTVVSASQITATAPAHASGTCDVVVTNPDGKAATLAQAFNYVPSQPQDAGVPNDAGGVDAAGVDSGTTTPTYQINCGGAAVSPFAADNFVTGGGTYTSNNAVVTSGVAHAAPSAVYQSERYGNHSYTFSNLAPNAPYTVRLHFAEIYWTSARSRVFNVLVNGTLAIPSLDIFAAVGANKALVRDVTTTTNGAGQITIQYVTITDNAKSSGIEIIPGGTTVPQIPTSVVVSPSTAQVPTGGTRTFTASVFDQFGSPMSTPQTVDWSVAGGGSISATGLFTAPNNPGPVVVTATDSGVHGTANVTVTSTSNVSYSTTFGVNESPISEGGRWKHNNPFFTKVVTNGGNAYGTEPNPARQNLYEDSYAYLGGMGFPPNQYASATIYKNGASGYMEVELLLRVSDTSNSTQGYECFLHQGGAYLSIARWKGTALTSPATISYFDILGGVNNITAPNDGDLFEAQIVGNIITVTLAGSQIISLDVSTFDGFVIPSGDPGIGFDAGGSGAESPDSSYGIKDYFAKGL